MNADGRQYCERWFCETWWFVGVGTKSAYGGTCRWRDTLAAHMASSNYCCHWGDPSLHCGRLRHCRDAAVGPESYAVSKTNGAGSVGSERNIWVDAASIVCGCILRGDGLGACVAKLHQPDFFSGSGPVFQCQSANGRAVAERTLSGLLRIRKTGSALHSVDLLRRHPPLTWMDRIYRIGHGMRRPQMNTDKHRSGPRMNADGRE